MRDRQQYEDDDDMFLADEEHTDMGDDPVPPPAVMLNPSRPPIPRTPAEQPQKRSLRVKSMPNGMRAKWPDVSTVLMTLQSGKQVMFVR